MVALKRVDRWIRAIFTKGVASGGQGVAVFVVVSNGRWGCEDRGEDEGEDEGGEGWEMHFGFFAACEG